MEKHKDDEIIMDELTQLDNIIEEVFKHEGKNWVGTIPHIKCSKLPTKENGK